MPTQAQGPLGFTCPSSAANQSPRRAGDVRTRLEFVACEGGDVRALGESVSPRMKGNNLRRHSPAPSAAGEPSPTAFSSPSAALLACRSLLGPIGESPQHPGAPHSLPGGRRRGGWRLQGRRPCPLLKGGPSVVGLHCQGPQKRRSAEAPRLGGCCEKCFAGAPRAGEVGD